MTDSAETRNINRGHPGIFREGEVLRQLQDFREKFWPKFRITLYILLVMGIGWIFIIDNRFIASD